jgi:hypothetical protein
MHVCMTTYERTNNGPLRRLALSVPDLVQSARLFAGYAVAAGRSRLGACIKHVQPLEYVIKLLCGAPLLAITAACCKTAPTVPQEVGRAPALMDRVADRFTHPDRRRSPSPVRDYDRKRGREDGPSHRDDYSRDHRSSRNEYEDRRDRHMNGRDDRPSSSRPHDSSRPYDRPPQDADRGGYSRGPPPDRYGGGGGGYRDGPGYGGPPRNGYRGPPGVS